MSNVVDLRHIVLDRLNGLEPHSRKRAGYVDLLRYLNAKEMREAVVLRELEHELDEVFQTTAGLV